MKQVCSLTTRLILLLSVVTTLVALSSTMRADTGMCGTQMISLPFTDVAAGGTFFCTIAEAYFSGLTNGTSATTYGPSTNVTRDQMSAFITRTLDQAIQRSSRRLALGQTWNPQAANSVLSVSIGNQPQLVESDGEDLWVANIGSGTVSQVHASNGKLVGTWTGATNAFGVLCVRGKVFVTGQTSPAGTLYRIDPRNKPGAVLPLSSSLGGQPQGIAYDGHQIWTANSDGSVSIITIEPSVSVINVTIGFLHPSGILFDGSNIWITDLGDMKLKKLDSSGNILMSVDVGVQPGWPVFDGMNIWVPNFISDSVTVVRASGMFSGTVLATLTGNRLSAPVQAAFDGERVLVTNSNGDNVSLWKASNLTGMGSCQMGNFSIPNGACSDGDNFWITLAGTDKLVKY